MKYLLLLLISCSQPVKNLIPIEEKFTHFKSYTYGDVAGVANCVLFLPEFKVLVEGLTYTFTKKTGAEIYQDLISPKQTAIKPFWTRNIFSNMVGTTFRGDDTIYFNARQTRKLENWVNTAFHERLHVLGYSHGDNKPKGKQDAPHFKIGLIAQGLVHKCL
jgi:hypothetical protein